jgi:hypothetical protein
MPEPAGVVLARELTSAEDLVAAGGPSPLFKRLTKEHGLCAAACCTSVASSRIGCRRTDGPSTRPDRFQPRDAGQGVVRRGRGARVRAHVCPVAARDRLARAVEASSAKSTSRTQCTDDLMAGTSRT